MTRCGSCGSENRVGARFCDSCGATLAADSPREQRKTVTVVFCDVAGSTALGESVDPEALRSLLARYFERMRAIVESHGGTVEKFIGDAVMAVFGVPLLHEDDALRAVRAAVDAEALEPLELKGKSEPVLAFRLLSVRQAPRPRAVSTTFVGRVNELELLRRAFARAEHERTCVLFTLLGTAGVGKSRLVEESLAGLDGARVVRGRCVSYGEGITYFPVVEVLIQLLGSEPEGRLEELAPDAVAAEALRGLLGTQTRPSSPQEAAWAFRKLLEAVAQSQPLVVVFDDVHWGEPAFFDLVEHVADLSRDAPILLLCV